MRFILRVTAAEDTDPEDCEMYLTAFREDLCRLDGLTLVSTNDRKDEMVLDSWMSEGELREAMRPIFSSSVGERVRYAVLTRAGTD